MDLKYEVVYLDGNANYFDTLSEAKEFALRKYCRELDEYISMVDGCTHNPAQTIIDISNLIDNGYIEYYCRIDECRDKYMWESGD